MRDKFIFLDRDGVINKDNHGITEYGYTTKMEEFNFTEGFFEGLKLLREAGFKVIVISNQQCVGKGIMTQEDLDLLTAQYTKEIEKHGGKIEKAYYCTHLKEENCDCRKPKAGMFKKAFSDFNINNIEGMLYVGDTERDITAGERAGLKTVLVLTGKAKEEDIEGWYSKPDYVCKDMVEIANLAIKLNKEI